MRMKRSGAIEKPHKNSPLRLLDPNPGTAIRPAFARASAHAPDQSGLIRADQHLGTAHRGLGGRTERFHEGVALETGGQVVGQHFGAAIDDHAGAVRDGWIRGGAGVDAGADGQAGDQPAQRGGGRDFQRFLHSLEARISGRAGGGQGRLLGGFKRDVGGLLGGLDRRRRRRIDAELGRQAADEYIRADRAAGQHRRQDVLD